MSPVRVTWRRTLGMARSLYSNAIATAGFFAGAAALFAFNLESLEGGRVHLAAVWTVSVAPLLPVLAALYGMDSWSDERRSGRVDMLLSAPVRERDLALGKFLGVWTMTLLAAAVFHIVSLVSLAALSPRLLSDASPFAFLPGFVALALQSALWSAVAVWASALFRHAAAAACATIALLSALPRGLWLAILAWAPQGRISFGEMPLDAQAFDMASGVVSSGTVISYLILTGVALFAASKAVASVRLVGRGARGMRFSTLVAVALSFVLAGLSIALAVRLDAKFDAPLGGPGGLRFSARTRNILEEAHGEITVTAFLSRKDARFRPVGHFLRALGREAESVGGVRVNLRYVDPKWDLGAAERLIRMGVEEDSLVFERGRRMTWISLRDGYGERICASAVLRVAMPPQRRSVYWTTGHGECSFEAYGNWGMSDIARDLMSDGYRNVALDLTGDAQVPSDCALVVVAGAKSEFSRVETGRLENYLRQGGRLLVLLNSVDAGGVATMLAGWGIRPTAAALSGVRTLSGTDVIVSEFSGHAIAAPLRGSQIVLERPVAFLPSAAADAGVGADRIEFSPLATAGGACVAAVTERGAGAGDDLEIRPTRIVAVGDVGFVMNGQLAARANANRDFFLNCVAYLSGTDAVTEAGTEADRLVSGMDRQRRVRFILVTSVAFPAAVFLVMVLMVAGRRRRE
ncbi:MAG: Gldg family protein [Kiritimatiellae bacterium]|nr:Gldg family protein [Kiritimatiellia bacterium]